MTSMRKLPALLSLALVATLPFQASAEAKPPKAVKHGYVVNRLILPTSSGQATQVAFDVDGDGDVDNRVGQLFSLLASQGVDVQSGADQAVDSGALVTLLSIQATSLKDAKGAKLRLFKGLSVAAPDLNGGGKFKVDKAAPKSVLKATITKKVVATKPGTVRLTLPSLFPGLPVVRFDLRHAQVAAKCTAERCSKGRIGGGISSAQIDAAVVPAIGAIARAAIAADCTGTTEDTCTEGSAGRTMMGIFDANDDGLVTDQEVRTNGLVQAMLAPDLDLDGDGTKDALSFGIGFSAANASIRGD